jgi:hypothetical protein
MDVALSVKPKADALLTLNTAQPSAVVPSSVGATPALAVALPPDRESKRI